jgi:60 kDa SS-A/Ro ribonucleoprotein
VANYLITTGVNGVSAENPQSKPMGLQQVRNEAGGFSWPLSDADRTMRFLVCGSEATFHCKMPELTLQNAAAIERILFLGDADGINLVDAIIDISVSGRAPKQSPAIFALAMCLSKGSDATKRRAVEAVPLVCRTGSTFFELVAYLDAMRGHGRTFRRALGAWYDSKSPEQLAFQGVKYRERAGWTHRDVLRQIKKKFDLIQRTPDWSASPPERSMKGEVAHWMVKGWVGVGVEPHPDSHLRQIWAYERAKAVGAGDVADLSADALATSREAEIIRLIREYKLPRECVPTQFLNNARVWDALLQHMPVGAMIRNLGKMGSVGLLDSADAQFGISLTLTNPDALAKARIHPIALLSALKVYASGHGVRGSLSWTPQARITDALDAAIYARMGAMAPTGKRILFAIDVSGSMHHTACSGLPHIAAHEAAAVLALTYLKTEPNVQIISFSAIDQPRRNSGLFTPALSARQRIDDAARTIQSSGNGGTDCALPVIWAGVESRPFDAFLIFTDDQSWAGNVHPAQALVRYREKVNPDARLVSAAVAASGTGIADPQDRGCLGIAGFDASAPAIIQSFLGQGDLVASDDGEPEADEPASDEE